MLVLVASEPMWQNVRTYQSPAFPTLTLMLSCCWCLDRIIPRGVSSALLWCWWTLIMAPQLKCVSSLKNTDEVKQRSPLFWAKYIHVEHLPQIYSFSFNFGHVSKTDNSIFLLLYVELVSRVCQHLVYRV